MESAGDQASSEYTGATYGLDSTQKFTVVTRFVTVDGTDKAINLKEIQRFYIQNGRTIQQPKFNGFNSLLSDDSDGYSSSYCRAFGQSNGQGGVSNGMSQGMVLSMSM
jgi:hypothetical protein